MKNKIDCIFSEFNNKSVMLKSRFIRLLKASIATLCLGLASVSYSATVDIFFLVDTTGDMGAEIANLQSNALSVIVPTAQAALGDVAFGVGSYQDFNIAPFGETNSAPYSLHLAITTNTTSFQAGVNSLNASGGGDAAESSLFALNSVATSSPGWRTGASRVIIWLGNAPGHDGDLEADYASCCSDVGLTDTINALIGSNVSVFAFDLGDLDLTGQATAITSLTGGTLTSGVDAFALSDVVSEVIQTSVTASVVPVPAAVWLFGSGLIGLIGIARRKKS